MAKHGLKWMDSDMHLAEPGDLWQRYIEPELRDKVPELTGVTPDYDVLSRSQIPAIEQILSAGAAAQNVMVAAFALGFGCAWKTGEAAYYPEIKAAFGLAATDAIVGFLYLGSNQKPPAPLEPLDLSAHVVEWRDEE